MTLDAPPRRGAQLKPSSLASAGQASHGQANGEKWQQVLSLEVVSGLKPCIVFRSHMNMHICPPLFFICNALSTWSAAFGFAINVDASQKMKSPLDVNRLRDRKSHSPRKPLPWFISPVDEDKTLKQQESYRSQHSNTSNHVAHQSDKSNVVDSRQLGLQSTHSTTSSGQRQHTRHAVVFKPRHESTAIELFYDLFFVANLTVYTNNNEIESADGTVLSSPGL